MSGRRTCCGMLADPRRLADRGRDQHLGRAARAPATDLPERPDRGHRGLNFAESLGRCLPERVVRASTTSPAAVVIDASGSPERIREALRRLDNLGTLVLACGVVGWIITNLYTDLHLRGLTIVAVPSQGDPS